MAQWHKLHWKDEHCVIGGIVIKPHTDKHGKKTAHASHDTHAWHELDWSEKSGMAHLHDGTVDHVHVLPQKRATGISVHAVWRDKDDKIVRQDAHFQAN